MAPRNAAGTVDDGVGARAHLAHDVAEVLVDVRKRPIDDEALELRRFRGGIHFYRPVEIAAREFLTRACHVGRADGLPRVQRGVEVRSGEHRRDDDGANRD